MSVLVFLFSLVFDGWELMGATTGLGFNYQSIYIVFFMSSLLVDFFIAMISLRSIGRRVGDSLMEKGELRYRQWRYKIPRGKQLSMFDD